MTDQHFTIRELQIAAVGWDAAVAACRYEDGTPVEFAEVVNPYREAVRAAESRERTETRSDPPEPLTVAKNGGSGVS